MTALLRLSGMDASTGQPLTGSAHLVQSIRDILTTPIGSRVMRRDYGSRLPALLARHTQRPQQASPPQTLGEVADGRHQDQDLPQRRNHAGQQKLRIVATEVIQRGHLAHHGHRLTGSGQRHRATNQTLQDAQLRRR